MSQYLFLFTITPVQSFIAQARKTQDLYAGSRILSALSKAAAKAIKTAGGHVIFPSNTEGESLPNRLLAQFNNIAEAELQQKGNAIANSITDVIAEYRKNAENKLGANAYNKIKEAFEKQLKGFFSTFWVFVPVKNGEYAEAYDEADRLLGAVKNIRTFEQNPEQGRKCSLSGEQNALVFGKGKNFPAYVNSTKACHCPDPKIQEKEGLSAISFIKRTETFGESFDSTTDIAILKSRQLVGEDVFQNYKDIYDDISKLLEKEKCIYLDNHDWIKYDEQFIYEENLNSQTIPSTTQLDLAKKYHKEIKEVFKKRGAKFTKYYALLLFDADSMGVWLSGKYLEDKKHLEAFHKHISGLLSGFAAKAKGLIDGTEGYQSYEKIKRGRTVYAGGDDYLGFVNLHYLFDVLKALREMFKTEVSDKLQVNTEGVRFQLKEKDEITFSAGITIAHYKEPLSEVLKWARNMEKEAKSTDNKDAFGLAVLKHSGEIHKTVLPFRDSAGNYISESLNTLVTKLKNEEFSSSFITNLERELSLFDEEFDYRKRIVLSESLRLTKRSQNKEKVMNKEEYKNITTLIQKIYTATEYRTELNDNHFHTTLNICDFINRKQTSNE